MGLLAILKGEQPGPLCTLLHYKDAGQFGEFAIEFALTNHNLPGDFVVLKNLYIPHGGRTSEIDLLLLHEKGIFVFESKNYSGWIFGTEEQIHWTQCLPNGEKFPFYNPVRQNQNHIKALARYLGLPVSEFTSYIVFSERCRLKKVPRSTEDVVIVRRPQMLKLLRRTLRHSRPVYSSRELRDIADLLRPLTRTSKAEKQEHIENIKTKCPLCGSDLVLRNGKYGWFWGCSAYPRCRFTRSEREHF